MPRATPSSMAPKTPPIAEEMLLLLPVLPLAEDCRALTITNERRGLATTAGAEASESIMVGLFTDRLQCSLLAVPERPISAAPLEGCKAPPLVAALGAKRERRLF